MTDSDYHKLRRDIIRDTEDQLKCFDKRIASMSVDITSHNNIRVSRGEIDQDEGNGIIEGFKEDARQTRSDIVHSGNKKLHKHAMKHNMEHHYDKRFIKPEKPEDLSNLMLDNAQEDPYDIVTKKLKKVMWEDEVDVVAAEADLDTLGIEVMDDESNYDSEDDISSYGGEIDKDLDFKNVFELKKNSGDDDLKEFLKGVKFEDDDDNKSDFEDAMSVLDKFDDNLNYGKKFVSGFDRHDDAFGNMIVHDDEENKDALLKGLNFDDDDDNDMELSALLQAL